MNFEVWNKSHERIEQILNIKFKKGVLLDYHFSLRKDFLSDNEQIEYFNYLISLADEKINIDLWNVISNYFDEDDEEYFKTMDKSIFYEGGYDFLTKFYETIKFENSTNKQNVGNIYESERLLIDVGGDEDEWENYQYTDSLGQKSFDLTVSTSTPQNTVYYRLNDEYSYSKNYIIVTFVLRLKDTKETIGTVQFYQLNCNSCEIGYCIYDKYRRHGYAYEAIKLLIDKLFSEGFKYYGADAEIAHKYYTKTYKPTIITATPNARNVSSTELLKKLGFTHGATLHNRRVDPYTDELLDVEYFYIEK